MFPPFLSHVNQQSLTSVNIFIQQLLNVDPPHTGLHHGGAGINLLVSEACFGRSVWFLLFPFKHSECCGSVDRLSTPALAGWGLGGVREGASERVRERESLLEEKRERG